MDNEKRLEIFKKDYLELYNIRRTYLAKSKRKPLFDTYNLTSFHNEEFTMIARCLIEWEVLNSANEVIYFFEKPWKWEHEINLLYIIFNNEPIDELPNVVEELIRNMLDNQISTYEKVKEVLSESLKETAEYITYYKKELTNAD